MNQPPYYITDVFGEKDTDENLIGGIFRQVQNSLGISVLNYQYGYITELNETLGQWVNDPELQSKMFPCVWLVQPFTLQKGFAEVYAKVYGGLRLIIMTSTTQDLKAKDRMSEKFKPIIYPIYEQTMIELNQNPAVQYVVNRPHLFTDRYYWPEQSQELSEVVDCSEISGLEFTLNNNSNCCVNNENSLSILN